MARIYTFNSHIPVQRDQRTGEDPEKLEKVCTVGAECKDKEEIQLTLDI